MLNFVSVDEDLPLVNKVCLVITKGHDGICLGVFLGGKRWDVQPFRNDWYTTDDSLVKKWAYIEIDTRLLDDLYRFIKEMKSDKPRRNTFEDDVRRIVREEISKMLNASFDCIMR